jgi:hypothetical protein
MKDEDRACSTHRKGVHWFWYENLKARDQCEKIDANGRIILKKIHEKLDAGVWTVLI